MMLASVEVLGSKPFKFNVVNTKLFGEKGCVMNIDSLFKGPVFN